MKKINNTFYDTNVYNAILTYFNALYLAYNTLLLELKAFIDILKVIEVNFDQL